MMKECEKFEEKVRRVEGLEMTGAPSELALCNCALYLYNKFKFDKAKMYKIAGTRTTPRT